MKNSLLLICNIVFFSCGINNFHNIPQLCDRCVLDQNDIYKAVTLVEMTEANSIKSLQPIYNTHKISVSKCTGISKKNNFYFYSYNATRDLYGVIIEEDYSTSLFLVAFNNGDVKFCVLVAATGGDGGDAYEISSQIKSDTLFKSERITSVVINPETDVFTDSLRVDSIDSWYLIEKNKSTRLLKSDTSSCIRKWK